VQGGLDAVGMDPLEDVVHDRSLTARRCAP
jgi:hypothetical protein